MQHRWIAAAVIIQAITMSRVSAFIETLDGKKMPLPNL